MSSPLTQILDTPLITALGTAIVVQGNIVVTWKARKTRESNAVSEYAVPLGLFLLHFLPWFSCHVCMSSLALAHALAEHALVKNGRGCTT